MVRCGGLCLARGPPNGVPWSSGDEPELTVLFPVPVLASERWQAALNHHQMVVEACSCFCTNGLFVDSLRFVIYFRHRELIDPEAAHCGRCKMGKYLMNLRNRYPT